MAAQSFDVLEDRLCCLGGWKEASEVGKTGCLNSGASAKRYLSLLTLIKESNVRKVRQVSSDTVDSGPFQSG